MKKVLIIDESSLFRDYLSKTLERFNFQILQAVNGLDGSVKMRNELPDLIIMDYYLSRKSSQDVLKEKRLNPNLASIPVIIVSSKLDKQKILEVANYNVKKCFSKPLKLDALLKTISEILAVKLEIDTTPCIIEAHFNEDILFIEIAQGLNSEKIDLLRYKIIELLELYQVKVPKILVMMSSLDLKPEDSGKLKTLFHLILEQGNTFARYIKVLTNNAFVNKVLQSDKELEKIEIYSNLEQAMDDLIGIKPDLIAHDEIARQKLLTSSKPKRDKEESFQFRFDGERETPKEGLGMDRLFPGANVAVVDDDIVIQELMKTVLAETSWNVTVFNNGREFIRVVDKESFDVVFLDLMMPEMNGFQVLQHLRQVGKEFPIIVFSALSKKETVVKAVSYGINSYMIKPLKPEKILRKALEILNANF